MTAESAPTPGLPGSEPEPRQGPATIIYEIGGSWSEIRNAVLRELLGTESPGDRSLRTRVRVGAILTDTSTVSGMEYGEHTTGVGRERQRHTERHKLAVELQRDARLRAVLAPYPSQASAVARPGVWANFNILGREAFSFSNIDARTLRALVELPEIRPHVVAAGHFDSTEWVQFHLLWACLIPHAIITDGRILEAIEDEPAFLNDDWTTLIDTGNLTFDDGAFWEVAGTICVDEHSSDCAIPLPVVGPDSKPLEHNTPIGAVMSRADWVTGPRISSQDTAQAIASVDRSFAFYEYPDPTAVEEKTRDFLLNRSHAKNRWRDFAKHGYLDVGDGPLRLAATLASTFHVPFMPFEVRPTADSALQFSVSVLLGSGHGTLPLMTSWVFRNGPPLVGADLDDPGSTSSISGLRLATAYVDRRQIEYALPYAMPLEPATRDWADLVTFVEAEARAACTRAAADADSTVGFLWVPRGTERQREFYDWICAHRESSTYRRRAYGGAVALYALRHLGNYEGETGVSTAMRLAQTLFGIVGIRTFVSLHFD